VVAGLSAPAIHAFPAIGGRSRARVPAQSGHNGTGATAGEEADVDALVDVESWPAIAAGLKGRWPEQAVVVDLEYWRSMVAARRLARVPGRRKLAARWGWSDWETRTVLEEADAPEEIPVASRSEDEEAPRFGHLRVVASQPAPEERPEPSRAVPSSLPSDLPSSPPSLGDGREKREVQGLEGSERDRDAVAAFERLLARRSAAEVSRRFRWRVESGAAGWFQREVLGRPEFAELDVAAALEALDDWTEREVEAAEAGEAGAKPIRNWKRGVLRWLRRELAFEAEERGRLAASPRREQRPERRSHRAATVAAGASMSIPVVMVGGAGEGR
jgi:hypothetical protein